MPGPVQNRPAALSNEIGATVSSTPEIHRPQEQPVVDAVEAKSGRASEADSNAQAPTPPLPAGRSAKPQAPPSYVVEMAIELPEHDAAWLGHADEHAALLLSKDPNPEHIDAFKSQVIDTLRKQPSLQAARQAADWIASLHNKPNHAKEIEAAADALYGDDERGEMIKQAARLIPLGEHLSSSALLRGGAMTPEQRKQHIFPINARAAAILDAIPGGKPYAQAIRGDSAQGLTPYLHAVRDLSAMDAPRAWRKDKYPPDGRLPPEAVDAELRDNDQKPGRDAAATDEVLERFSKLVHKRSAQ